MDEQIQISEVTQLLGRWRGGDDEALKQLMPLVYPQLRAIAARSIRSRRGEQTLQATGLVHEAYIRLLGQSPDFNDRVHFFAVAAKTMRRVLVDYFRSQQAVKRGGQILNVTLDEDFQAGDPGFPVDRLEAVLCDLETMDPRKCRIAEMHYFAGMAYQEIAEVMQLSRATVARDLEFTRTWISAQLQH